MKIGDITWQPIPIASKMPDGTIFLWKHSGGRIELVELFGNLQGDTSIKVRCFYTGEFKRLRRFKDAGIFLL